MNKDLNKGITEIQYNSLNLPEQMVINSSSVKAKNYYTYSASGVKLKTEQRYDPTLSVAPVSTTTPANDGLSNYYTNKDYVGNIIYETEKKGTTTTNKTKILVDGGYIENNVYHYYLTDHLGNNRIVANASGTVIQKNHYYPFGTTFAEGTTAEQGKQPYKYNGKELDQMHGLNLYDYSARYYESAIGRFTTVDPLAEKYYSISPYAYCGNNPINAIDPDGRDIIILRNSAGAGPGSLVGHAAVLIGSNEKGWTYISKDGYAGSSFGSQSKYVVQTFKTLDDFSNSPHNFELNSGTHSTTSGDSAKNFDFKLDSDGNKIQRYDKSLLIETTQKDGTSTDSKAIDAATVSARKDYTLTVNDCSDVVTSTLDASKNSQGNQVKNGESKFGGLNGERPNRKFNLIEQRNADAQRIDEQLKPKN